MTKKEMQKKLVGEPIKEYKMPLIKRLAYYRPVTIWTFWTILTAIIVAPTILANYANFWYYLSLAPLIFFFGMAVIAFIRFSVYAEKHHSVMDEDAQSDDACESHEGAPGTGKSYVAKERIYAKAKYSWEEVQFEYWQILDKLSNPKYVPNEDEQEIIDAYQFNIQNNGIPELASNIPLYSERYRRYSYELTLDHFKQEKRLPYRICMFQDEIGTLLNFLTSMMSYAKDNNDEMNIDDIFRLIRHFFEGRLIGTEQDGANIAIFFRRVASDNKRFDKKQWVLKPRFLFWLYMKLRRRFIKKMSVKQSKRYARFMRLLKTYIFNCGFFKFTYKSCGNLETGSKSEKIVIVMKEKKTCYYLPRASEISYHTRAFKNGYKCLDKPIDLKVHTSRKLTREQAVSMLKSESVKRMREQAEQKKSENLSKSKQVKQQKKASNEVLQF